MSFTNYGENLLLNFAFNATGSAPANLYLALHTADPTETGAVAEMTTGSDSAYARQSITFANASNGQCLSDAVVSHTPAFGAAAYTVTHVSIWDAATSGNCIMYGALAVPRTIDNANPISFSAGDVIAALD